MALSVPTLIVYTAVLMLVITGALVLPSTRGQGRRWLMAASLPFLVGFLAAAVFGLDYAFPSQWLETVGVTFVIAAFSAGWYVVRNFTGRSARLALALLFPFSYALLSALIFIPWQLEAAEAVYRTAATLVLNGLIARDLAPGRAPELPSRPVLRGVFLIFAVLAAFRIVLSPWLPSPLGAATSQAWSVAAYNFGIVIQALVTAVLLVALAREREAARNEAMSLQDPMTGALNRRALERHGAVVAIGGQPLTVLAFDLDHFKRINDRFGHSVGDAVICTAVETARSVLREDDAVFRLGGEEFACVLRGVTPEVGVSVAERLCRSFEEAGRNVAGQRVGATMSVGIASAPAGAAIDLEDLIAEADRGLYRAKNRGRNQVAEAA
ncbi:GGDEF domain-containing protein [Muricoccus pecuniae]|nr:GGDEF domain-containing protein [Roseomonas pecuniae]